MLNFFVALLACQLFRGILPSSISDGVYNITFSNPLNSFIGIYQILSTDLWSNILFDLTASGKASAAGILGPIFLMIWFMSAQCKQRGLFFQAPLLTENRYPHCLHRSIPGATGYFGRSKIHAPV